MTNRVRAGVAVGVAALLGVVAWVAWPRGGEPSHHADAGPAEAPPGEGDDNPFASWLDDQPPGPDERRPPDRGARQPDEGSLSDEERQRRGYAAGREWRREWESMSDEERAARRAEWMARMRSRVEIVPLGPDEPTLAPEQVFQALGQHRGEMRDCMREAGGFRAMAQGSDPSRRRTMGFDVGPDGRVAPGTVSFDPPLPDPDLARCFSTVIESASLGNVGGDGARVDLPLPGRRRGRRSADGGVGRGPPRPREPQAGEAPREPPREPREPRPPSTAP